ncbi:MAG: glyoxylate/hydroxypyruvate reductase A [Paracoccaceae bacterium]|nr:glyoxylate/hydroxypyruvate reductase A [Paracoccaceae bacterium]MDP7186388.1 glyoxylate/hydroxypyruvate reductase A [Paracoccaceae bacterium]
MPVNVLFASLSERWEQYQTPLLEAFSAAGVEADLRDAFPPEQVDYIVYAPNSSVQDFTPYTRCKAVLSLWAGVEAVVDNETLKVPLTRMVDQGLSDGMREWVCGHVLRHHLGMDAHIHGQDGQWRLGAPALAKDRRVVIFGFGVLGQACGEALCDLGFQVYGWSNSQKSHDRIGCFSGAEGFRQSLAHADIAVLLLPWTPDTESLFDANAFAAMPEGAVILNPGRGGLINDTDLIAALDSGHLAHATLDVFRVEPLPADDPFWTHPKVTVTPHIASETRASSAAEVIAENIRRAEAGEPLLFLVDRTKGY